MLVVFIILGILGLSAALFVGKVFVNGILSLFGEDIGKTLLLFLFGIVVVGVMSFVFTSAYMEWGWGGVVGLALLMGCIYLYNSR